MLDPYNDHEGLGHPDSIIYIKSMKSNLSLAFLSEGGTHVGGAGSFRECSKGIFKAISGEVTPMTPKCKKNLYPLDSAIDFPKTYLLHSNLSSHYPKLNNQDLSMRQVVPNYEKI